jgi:ribosomal-protein-alanine N-acetyltransferase
VIEAGIAHAEVMAALHGAAFPHDPWDAASFVTLVAQPGVLALVDPRGGILLLRVAADEAEILTIGVTAKRRGIGRALMQTALARAAAMGAAAMHLEVAADNAAALALYRSLAFRTAGRRRAYYPNGQDALILTHDIGPTAST